MYIITFGLWLTPSFCDSRYTLQAHTRLHTFHLQSVLSLGRCGVTPYKSVLRNRQVYLGNTT
jgi:hypothetical protein